METNEYLQTALRQEAEVEVLKLVDSLPTLKEGDLKGVETHVLERIMSVGRKWMECILSHESPCEPPPVRREGACGHEQHLVGVRPPQAAIDHARQGDVLSALLSMCEIGASGGSRKQTGVFAWGGSSCQDFAQKGPCLTLVQDHLEVTGGQQRAKARAHIASPGMCASQADALHAFVRQLNAPRNRPH